jgi:hypothetical protein
MVVKEMLRLARQLETKPHLRRRNRARLTAQLEVITGKAADQFFTELDRLGISSLLLHPNPPRRRTT